MDWAGCSYVFISSSKNGGHGFKREQREGSQKGFKKGRGKQKKMWLRN